MGKGHRCGGQDCGRMSRARARKGCARARGGRAGHLRKPTKSAPHATTMLNKPSSAGWMTGAIEGKTSGVTNQKLMERLIASMVT